MAPRFRATSRSTPASQPVAPPPRRRSPAAAAGTDVTVTTGKAYNITETVQPNYTVAYSAGCTGTLSSGQTATCTITNTFQLGTLTVKKVVVGGALQPSDFSLNVSVQGSGTATPSTSTEARPARSSPSRRARTTPSARRQSRTTRRAYSAALHRKLQRRRVGDVHSDEHGVGGGGGTPANGTFDLVARPYAFDDAAGPVEYLLLTTVPRTGRTSSPPRETARSTWK